MRRLLTGYAEAGSFKSQREDRLDFESGAWDFAGGDSEATRGLHLGHRQGYSEKAEANLQGVKIQLPPLFRMP